MPSQIKVDQIAGATGSTVTLPSGQTLDLSSGTVNLPSTSLSTLNATNLTTGTVPNARLSGITADKLDLISTASVPSITAKGTPSVSDGYIQLNCEQNSHGIKIKSPPHSAGATYTMVMPNAIGTSDQVLKMNSGATALEFATASSDYVLLNTTTLSSTPTSISIDGQFSATYRNYEFYFDGISSTTSAYLACRMNIGGTAQTHSLYKGTNLYGLVNTSSTQSAGAYTYGFSWTANAILLSNDMPAGTNNRATGKLTLFNPLGTSYSKGLNGYFQSFNGGESHHWNNHVGGQYYGTNGSPVTGLTFFFDTGSTFQSGAVIKLYGIK